MSFSLIVMVHLVFLCKFLIIFPLTLMSLSIFHSASLLKLSKAALNSTKLKSTATLCFFAFFWNLSDNEDCVHCSSVLTVWLFWFCSDSSVLQFCLEWNLSVDRCYLFWKYFVKDLVEHTAPLIISVIILSQSGNFLFFRHLITLVISSLLMLCLI